jgi:hypothetical protein
MTLSATGCVAFAGFGLAKTGILSQKENRQDSPDLAPDLDRHQMYGNSRETCDTGK